MAFTKDKDPRVIIDAAKYWRERCLLAEKINQAAEMKNAERFKQLTREHFEYINSYTY